MPHLTSDPQDSQDMARLVGGHDGALNDLMERYAQKIFHYLLRSLQNEEDAADLTQETFVRVYQNRSKFNQTQKFSTWLYAIASNLVRDRYRWRSRHPQVSMDAEAHETGAPLKDTFIDASPTPVEALQKTEKSEAVKAAIATLPLEIREPLILTVYEGLSQVEIGEILNCSAKAVETRIYRARKQLREKLGALVASC